jgi:hypothetical protein
VFWDNTCDHVYEKPDAARLTSDVGYFGIGRMCRAQISATLSINFLESVIKGVRFAADSALEQTKRDPPRDPSRPRPTRSGASLLDTSGSDRI